VGDVQRDVRRWRAYVGIDQHNDGELARRDHDDLARISREATVLGDDFRKPVG
jgi:hypothetical protein